jgi:hypothetical protein
MIPQMIDPLIKTMIPMIATMTAIIHKRLADITTSCGHRNEHAQANRGSRPVPPQGWTNCSNDPWGCGPDGVTWRTLTM